ncbi:MAG TPA: chloride channel protein [Tepidisphaeraceae bacterium]|nr:chloride channel protein [Tepidisphaeraceae bacterium]
MVSWVAAAATRGRVLITRLLAAVGFRDDAFLLVVAAMVGILTAGAAVGFHELIMWIVHLLYRTLDPQTLYGTGLALIVVWPALGGLVVGFLNVYVIRQSGGHGVPDVIESVAKSSGFLRPRVAIEKMVTAAVTIGSGGSVGAEGPIVQIGAALASGIGQLFRLARSQMTLIVGCGTAAGISAIFNSPMGGVLFTLEVILLDFSLRTFIPVVVASVIANVATRAIFSEMMSRAETTSIFSMTRTDFMITWNQVPSFVLVGLGCGIVAATLTLLMLRMDARFRRLRMPTMLKPMLGGALLGLIGLAFIVVFGWFVTERAKPISADWYPMPAFFGDGYGFIQMMLGEAFYQNPTYSPTVLLSMLAFLIVAKLVGTCLTLASGGSGGVIAPALFLGATTGGFIGVALRELGWVGDVQPAVFALVGMGAALGATVHAPLAAILILIDITGNYRMMLPAMLATVVATAIARRIYPDSIYTAALRERGLRLTSGSDAILLRRMLVEQVHLEPAVAVQASDTLQHLLELKAKMGSSNFVVLDRGGFYSGMVAEEDVYTALVQREAVPLLLAGELMRPDVPLLRNSDSLARVLEVFSRYDVDYLPVSLEQSPGKVIGLISRAGLMRTYQMELVDGS